MGLRSKCMVPPLSTLRPGELPTGHSFPMTQDHLPVVSAIIPARNEEQNIARAVRSLTIQTDVLEIIVVDDQSQDQTPEILAELSRQYAKLRVLRLERLPIGWLGKPHAAAAGARLASGGWLLFTDADTEHRPGSLSQLRERAERESVDLLSISPGQRMETWWEKGVIPLVYTQLARLYPFDEVNDPHSPSAAANGQYILIRRNTYEAIGGHEAVRNEVLEDVELARRVKSMGGKILFLPGTEWVETRMYRTFAEMWRGWTKNLFLLYGRRSGNILKAALELMLEWAPGVLLLGLDIALMIDWRNGIFYVAIACLLAHCAVLRTYSRQFRRLGFPVGIAFHFWVGAPLFVLLLINSFRAYRSGVVEWKGRTYSVKEVA
jgi:glycosyltransferase involved in cell wall biosynthesis